MTSSISASLGALYLNLADNWALEKTSPSFGSMPLLWANLGPEWELGNTPLGAHGCGCGVEEACAKMLVMCLLG